ARQELRDAMQRQAGDEEIERLIQQLYDAMAKWQKELAEKMQDPEERRRMMEQAEKMDPNNTITGDDLQKMLDKIREMAKNGQHGGQQKGLRRQLGEFRNKLDENGMGMPEWLGRAERSMREAEDALRRGDPREASRAQRRALDNLQQGMGDMAEQMRQRGPGNGQDIAEIEERERRSEDRDPLGRSDGNFGDSVDDGVEQLPREL